MRGGGGGVGRNGARGGEKVAAIFSRRLVGKNGHAPTPPHRPPPFYWIFAENSDKFTLLCTMTAEVVFFFSFIFPTRLDPRQPLPVHRLLPLRRCDLQVFRRHFNAVQQSPFNKPTINELLLSAVLSLQK